MSRPVLSCRIGVAGAGKTLSCVIWTCTEFLPFEAGKLITNLPFLPEKIADRYAGTKGVNGPMTREEILDRFEVIPDEVLRQWSEEQGGPWEYFHGKSIAAAHIMLDEAHNFVGSKHSAKWRKAWQSWIGELRHQGATIEMVTQAEGKLAKEFKEEAERQVFVVSSDTRREPLFGIELGDIYQLLAKLIPARGYRAATWVEEKRNAGGRKFVVEKEHKFGRDAHWFELYDSHNTPTAGGVAGRRKLQYEILTWPSFLKWFLVRNLMNVLTANTTRAAVIAFLLAWPTSRNLFVSTVQGAFEAGRKNAKAGQPLKAAGVGHVPAAKPPEPTLAPGGEAGLDANRTTQAITETESLVRRSRALTPDQRDQVIHELQEARAAHDREFELNRQFVGIVGDNILLMRNGDRYGLDERIQEGPLEGRKVVDIDSKRRVLLLDDGRRIKLGGVPQPPPADGKPSDGGSGLPGPESRVSGTLRRDPVGTPDESGRNLGRPRTGAAVRGGAPVRPGMGFGPVERVDRRGPGAPDQPGGAAPAVGNGR